MLFGQTGDPACRNDQKSCLRGFSHQKDTFHPMTANLAEMKQHLEIHFYLHLLLLHVVALLDDFECVIYDLIPHHHHHADSTAF
jgi:hypothetical protein